MPPALGIAGSVRFLGFRDDLRALYPAFDIYCHSSLELAAEMFPSPSSGRSPARSPSCARAWGASPPWWKKECPAS